MEKIKIKDRDGEIGYVLQFVFSNERGVLAIIVRKDGKMESLPLSHITAILKADK